VQQVLDSTYGESQPAATSLSNNGMATSANHGSHTDLDVFSTNLVKSVGATSITGVNSAIDQLADGNLVTVAQDAGTNSIHFRLTTSTGSFISSADLVDTGNTDADVAGLTGGRFVVVAEDLFGGTDTDIHVWIRNADGSAFSDFYADFSTNRDLKPSVAALDNGNFVVGWHREVGVNTEAWFAIYDADGNTIFAPAISDAIGTVNQNVELTSTVNGFANAYEDNGWGTGTNDITLGQYSFTGAFINWTNVSNPSNTNDGSEDANPRATRLTNDMLVVGWENNSFGDTDNLIALFDPATSSQLTTANVAAGESIVDDVGDMAIASSFNSRVNVFHTNFTDSDVDGQSFTAKRTSTGDAADDFIVGDDLVDFMLGGNGNDQLQGGKSDDTLNGQNGDDTLNGDAGRDILIGGAGADTMDGGVGSDAAFYTQSPSAVSIDLLLNSISGGHATGDVLTNIERLTGSAFNDFLAGGNADNILIGGVGDDTIYGDDGKDTLKGDAGSDTLWGGNGVDSLRGGADADFFQYIATAESGFGAANRDRIFDFTKADGDKIDVSQIDGQTSNGGSVAFTSFIGGASFTAEGQIRAFQVGAATVVQFNTTGATGAEMEIVLNGFTAATLDINDFIIGSPMPPMMIFNPGETENDLEVEMQAFVANEPTPVSGETTLNNQVGSITHDTSDALGVSGNHSTQTESAAKSDLAVLDLVFAGLTL
jgi:Ca2+-binding RTX toxin-like protein